MLDNITKQCYNCRVEANTEDTMEILLYYLLPNIALFGGIYILAKAAEHAVWHFISNYDTIVAKLQGN